MLSSIAHGFTLQNRKPLKPSFHTMIPFFHTFLVQRNHNVKTFTKIQSELKDFRVQKKKNEEARNVE